MASPPTSSRPRRACPPGSRAATARPGRSARRRPGSPPPPSRHIPRRRDDQGAVARSEVGAARTLRGARGTSPPARGTAARPACRAPPPPWQGVGRLTGRGWLRGPSRATSRRGTSDRNGRSGTRPRFVRERQRLRPRSHRRLERDTHREVPDTQRELAASGVESPAGAVRPLRRLFWLARAFGPFGFFIVLL